MIRVKIIENVIVKIVLPLAFNNFASNHLGAALIKL
jgi:hypothetical protein